MLEPMRRALALADAALGTTSPNPTVGAVLVREGRIVGEGVTQPPGGPHAEVGALAMAGGQARGATLYVTLEPCNHHGRTPPCTEALLAAGVAEVVVGYEDPDVVVAGTGIQRLAAGGVEVRHEVELAQEIATFYRPYTRHRRTGRPWVIGKYAMSLDGRIATHTGDSKWISGEPSRAWVHEQRERIDAIVVGSGTVLADNPTLTARPAGRSARHQPLRVVLDGRGRTPLSAAVYEAPPATAVYTSAASDATWRQGLAARGVAVVTVPPAAKAGVLLDATLEDLGRRGVVTAMVEGGAALLGSALDDELLDEVWVFVAPVLIGGATAPGPLAGAGFEFVRDAARLVETSHVSLGADVLIRGLLRSG